jgi:hypothetical protein
MRVSDMMDDGEKRASALPDVLSLSQTPAEVLQNWSLFLDYWTNL